MGPTQPPPITSITSISPLSPSYPPLSLSIGNIHQKSTDGHQHLVKHEEKRDHENGEAIWPWGGAGRLTPPLGRPSCCFPLCKSHSFLATLGLQHNTILAPEFRIPFQNFVVEFLLRSSVGVRKSERKFGCESSAKILRKRERGVAEIWERLIEFKCGSAVQIKRGN